jgi:hypothetical protein
MSLKVVTREDVGLAGNRLPPGLTYAPVYDTQ